MKNKLLDIFNQKDDSADISIKFFQLIKGFGVKSFYLHQNQSDCNIRFFTVDDVFEKNYIQRIDSATVLNIFSSCDRNREIFNQMRPWSELAEYYQAQIDP